MASATDSAARVKEDAMKTNPTMNDTKVRDMYFSFCFNFTSANFKFNVQTRNACNPAKQFLALHAMGDAHDMIHLIRRTHDQRSALMQLLWHHVHGALRTRCAFAAGLLY